MHQVQLFVFYRIWFLADSFNFFFKCVQFFTILGTASLKTSDTFNVRDSFMCPILKWFFSASDSLIDS